MGVLRRDTWSSESRRLGPESIRPGDRLNVSRCRVVPNQIRLLVPVDNLSSTCANLKLESCCSGTAASIRRANQAMAKASDYRAKSVLKETLARDLPSRRRAGASASDARAGTTGERPSTARRAGEGLQAYRERRAFGGSPHPRGARD